MEVKTKKNTAIISLYAVLLMYITYCIAMKELANKGSDFWGHVYTYIPMIQGKAGEGGWMAAPYFMWHLIVLAINGMFPVPIEAAAAFSSCIFAVFGFYVLYWMTARVVIYHELEYSDAMIGFVAFSLSVIQPLCMYWFDTTNQYLGQFSINPLHNPTHMCVKPFSVLCLCFTYDILQKFQTPEHNGIFTDVSKGVKKTVILLSVTLFFSCMAKPTFAEMFIPATGIFMLIEWIRRMVSKDGTAKTYFSNCLTMLLAAVPSLAYIVFQFTAYFILGGSYGNAEGGVIITKWMQVWRMFSENVAVSIVLGMGFPLFIVLFNGEYFIKSVMGRLALLCYGAGLLECALLAESSKMSHGDFLWPMMSGMTMLWIAATMRFLILEQKQNQTKTQQLVIHVAWLLFGLYVLFGGIFIVTL